MTFRYERKYLLSTHLTEVLKSRIAAVLFPDPHSEGRYWVHNYYFDDLHETAYKAKRRGAFIRDKYRIRYYNNDLSYIRLENKHKEGELSAKNSVLITPEQLNELVNGHLPHGLADSGAVGKDFARLYHNDGLRMVAAFSYYREAFIHMAGNVRITFDSRIAEEIPGSAKIFEIKYTQYFPSFIKDLMAGLPLTQVSFSKFNMVMDWNRKVRGNG